MPPSLDDINKNVSGDFLTKLTNCLFELPGYEEKIEREKKYWTAEQIKDELGLPFTSEEIEEVLLKLWQDKNLEKIRPAKYPHQSKLVRLWGHVDKLFPVDSDDLQQYRFDQVEPLDEFALPDDAHNIFLSFSYRDKDLAIIIRKRFAAWNWRAWLYINQIQLGSNIVNEVRSAISDCDAAFVLITGTSIGSAWVYSEFESLKEMRKPLCAIFNINNTTLLDVLKTWVTGPHYHNKYGENEAALLVKEYESKKRIHHVGGYRKTMETFLSCLSFFDKLILYPGRPANWHGPVEFIDFDKLESSLLA